MYAIDLMICRPDYWLTVYKRKDCWQFSLYFPAKKFYCNTEHLCYTTRIGCLNSAREIAIKFLIRIAEL